VAHPKGPGGLDTDALRRSWPDVLEWLSRNKRVTWTFVAQNAQVLDYDGQRVLLGISTVGLAETFRRGAHADYVRQALIDVLGVDARVEGVPSDDAGAASNATPPPAVAPAPPAGSGNPAPSPAPGVAARFGDPTASGTAARHEPASEAAADGAAPGSAPSHGGRSASWSDAPPPPDTAPSWASPLELAKAAVAVEDEVPPEQRVVDDTAISVDDESIDALTDVGVPVVERILGGTVIAEDSR
jgi:DNA polymerase-3 subunit gamma/tau